MLTFNSHEVPDLEYNRAVKKPIPLKCKQIMEPFTVVTMEGIMTGKAGDWLMVGINGEMYPIDHEIFQKTYDLLD